MSTTSVNIDTTKIRMLCYLCNKSISSLCSFLSHSVSASISIFHPLFSSPNSFIYFHPIFTYTRFTSPLSIHLLLISPRPKFPTPINFLLSLPLLLFHFFLLFILQLHDSLSLPPLKCSSYHFFSFSPLPPSPRCLSSSQKTGQTLIRAKRNMRLWRAMIVHVYGSITAHRRFIYSHRLSCCCLLGVRSGSFKSSFSPFLLTSILWSG